MKKKGTIQNAGKSDGHGGKGQTDEKKEGKRNMDGVVSRLDELAKLRKGWLDGTGEPPSRMVIYQVKRLMTTDYPADLVYPYVYPTPEGHLLLEWSMGSHEISLTIDGFSLKGAWHCLDLVTGRETEGSLDPANEMEWKMMIMQLRAWERTGNCAVQPCSPE